MTKTRTKQQVACDGIKMSWSQPDTFTDILQHQVHNQFSIDGVIPVRKRVILKTSLPQKTFVQNFVSVRRYMQGLDGIRVSLKSS